MTIHAYYGDYSHLKNEQNMFEDLLTQLKLHWEYSEEWIYLFYNTMWNGQEIDVIAFTQDAIIVIDLKKYSGELFGTENGEWLINNEVPVKGGSQINPFVQIRKNKFAVINSFQSSGLFSNQNLGFISGCIIFDELSNKNLELSQVVQKWFYVTDIPNSVDTLSKIKSNGINISSDDITYLISKMKLKEYSWNKDNKPRDIRFIISNDNQNHTTTVISHHQPSLPLKNTLNKVVGKTFHQGKFEYILFILTILISLSVSFMFASKIKNNGLSNFLFEINIFNKKSDQNNTIDNKKIAPQESTKKNPSKNNEILSGTSVLGFNLRSSTIDSVKERLNNYKINGESPAGGPILESDGSEFDVENLAFVQFGFDANQKLAHVSMTLKENDHMSHETYKKIVGYIKKKKYKIIKNKAPFVGNQETEFLTPTNEIISVKAPHMGGFNVYVDYSTKELSQQISQSEAANF